MDIRTQIMNATMFFCCQVQIDICQEVKFQEVKIEEWTQFLVDQSNPMFMRQMVHLLSLIAKDYSKLQNPVNEYNKIEFL